MSDTPSPEASPVPTPYSRIRASAIGAGNLARQLAQNDRVPQWIRDEATKIVLLLSDVPYDIDAVRELVGCYERDMAELIEEANQRERLITSMQQTHNADASDSAYLRIPLTREPQRAASGE